jgi:hypothetical protein
MFAKFKKMLRDNNLRKSGLVHAMNICHLDLGEALEIKILGLDLYFVKAK